MKTAPRALLALLLAVSTIGCAGVAGGVLIGNQMIVRSMSDYSAKERAHTRILTASLVHLSVALVDAVRALEQDDQP